MESDELPNVALNIDYETILPIQQKRTITFVNNFIMNTVSFLNHFSQSCESRLMEFEYKMQKLEAALLILESQLSSIPDIDFNSHINSSSNVEEQSSQDVLELPEVLDNTDLTIEQNYLSNGLTVIQDPRFSKFFKMVQVGVPIQAVKNKMAIEGLDPSVLDNPNEVIPGSSAEISDLKMPNLSPDS